jgi:YggT family protein
MNALIDILIIAAQAINMLVIVWFILGLLFAFNVVNHSNEFLVALNNAIARLFEPVLRPIRKVLPDTRPIDFSPMVMILILIAIVRILSELRP